MGSDLLTAALSDVVSICRSQGKGARLASASFGTPPGLLERLFLAVCRLRETQTVPMAQFVFLKGESSLWFVSGGTYSSRLTRRRGSLFLFLFAFPLSHCGLKHVPATASSCLHASIVLAKDRVSEVGFVLNHAQNTLFDGTSDH